LPDAKTKGAVEGTTESTVTTQQTSTA
jgi:hypothetical protein